MGYLTYFTLSCLPHNQSILLSIIDQTPECYWDQDPEDDDLENITELTAHDKWRFHNNDMRAISKSYPDTLFILKSAGEDNNVRSYTYYKNGKSQYCPAITTFEPFNEAKLK